MARGRASDGVESGGYVFDEDRVREIRAELGTRLDREFSPRLSAVVDLYNESTVARDEFVWRWHRSLAPEFTLSSVPAEHRQRVADLKTIASVFVTVLDDLAETHNDTTTFREAAKVPFEHKSVEHDREGVRTDDLAIAEEVWATLAADLADAPRRSEYRRLLEYDVEQVVNSMRYAGLVNDDLDALNPDEVDRFDAYNMMAFLYADIDLMFSPGFDRSELGAFRRVTDRAQRMARIGNWLSTWERELAEGDVSSGVVARALAEGVVDRATLAACPDSKATRERTVAAVREAGIEEDLQSEWLAYRKEALELADAVDSVDLVEYVVSADTVTQYHLASRGLK